MTTTPQVNGARAATAVSRPAEELSVANFEAFKRTPEAEALRERISQAFQVGDAAKVLDLLATPELPRTPEGKAGWAAKAQAQPADTLRTAVRNKNPYADLVQTLDARAAAGTKAPAPDFAKLKQAYADADAALETLAKEMPNTFEVLTAGTNAAAEIKEGLKLMNGTAEQQAQVTGAFSGERAPDVVKAILDATRGGRGGMAQIQFERGDVLAKALVKDLGLEGKVDPEAVADAFMAETLRSSAAADLLSQRPADRQPSVDELLLVNVGELTQAARTFAELKAALAP